jgi:predicted Zn-dependent protease
MDPGGPVLEDELVTAAIQEMLDRLTPYRDLPDARFQFRVVESDEVNAFALPGGYITVYTGLILESDDPAQVAGVLAHEMAHVTLRHGIERVAHQVASYAALFAILGDAEGLTRVALEVFTLKSVNEYGQDQESEADLVGVDMLLGARIDPLGLADFFRLLEEKYGDVPDGVAWLSTHPQHAERVRAIRARVQAADALPEFEPFDFDWDEVKARLR